MRLLASKGMRIVRPKKNPKRTRVAKCVRKVKRSGRKVRSAIAVCQKSTRQSYRTGKRLAANPAPYRYMVSLGGTRIARFLTLQHAKQYAQALANKSGRQVRVTA